MRNGLFGQISKKPKATLSAPRVLIHSSTAKFILRMQLAKPPEVCGEQWYLAIDSRIFGLTLARPGMSAKLPVVGDNQHMGSDENAQLRGILLSTLANTKADILNLNTGGLFVWSRTRAADRLTSDWASQHTLREVLSEPLRATWKACLLNKRAV